MDIVVQKLKEEQEMIKGMDLYINNLEAVQELMEKDYKIQQLEQEIDALKHQIRFAEQHMKVLKEYDQLLKKENQRLMNILNKIKEHTEDLWVKEKNETALSIWQKIVKMLQYM